MRVGAASWRRLATEPSACVLPPGTDGPLRLSEPCGTRIEVRGGVGIVRP